MEAGEKCQGCGADGSPPTSVRPGLEGPPDRPPEVQENNNLVVTRLFVVFRGLLIHKLFLPSVQVCSISDNVS